MHFQIMILFFLAKEIKICSQFLSQRNYFSWQMTVTLFLYRTAGIVEYKHNEASLGTFGHRVCATLPNRWSLSGFLTQHKWRKRKLSAAEQSTRQRNGIDWECCQKEVESVHFVGGKAFENCVITEICYYTFDSLTSKTPGWKKKFCSVRTK